MCIYARVSIAAIVLLFAAASFNSYQNESRICAGLNGSKESLCRLNYQAGQGDASRELAVNAR